LSESLSELEVINKHLIDKYGFAVDGNHPKFRMVWSTDQKEQRLGTFKEHTKGGIFLREVTGVQEVPRYPFDKDRWVLEHLCYLNPNGVVAKELVNNKFSYEPLRILKDKDGNFLPLNLNAIEIFIHFFINRGNKKKGASELLDWYEKKEQKKREQLGEMIGEMLRSPYFGDLVY
jgi:hypothetical protein